NMGYRLRGVYNASPTYHFRYDRHELGKSLRDVTRVLASRLYAERSAHLRSRESLQAANAKYRIVAQKNDALLQGGSASASRHICDNDENAASIFSKRVSTLVDALDRMSDVNVAPTHREIRDVIDLVMSCAKHFEDDLLPVKSFQRNSEVQRLI